MRQPVTPKLGSLAPSAGSRGGGLAPTPRGHPHCASPAEAGFWPFLPFFGAKRQKCFPSKLTPKTWVPRTPPPVLKNPWPQLWQKNHAVVGKASTDGARDGGGQGPFPCVRRPPPLVCLLGHEGPLAGKSLSELANPLCPGLRVTWGASVAAPPPGRYVSRLGRNCMATHRWGTGAWGGQHGWRSSSRGCRCDLLNHSCHPW